MAAESSPSHGAPIRALIVDDEPLARRTIRILLQTERDMEVAGECGEGVSAIDAIREESPDLLFLDVQMPGMDGFEVLRALKKDRLPAIIFTTAYDQYVLKAFEVHALDYLLKPFDDERFAESVRHARRVIAGHRKGEMSRQLLDLLERLEVKERMAHRMPLAPDQYMSRLLIRSGERAVVLETARVDFIEAAGNYVNISSGGRKHLLRERMNALEARLDPAKFTRIHRSTIVRTELIKSLKPLINGDYTVTMTDGREFVLSRTYRERVLASLA